MNEKVFFKAHLVPMYRMKTTYFSLDKCRSVVWRRFFSATISPKKEKLEFNVSSNEIMRENAEWTTSNVKLVSSNEMKCKTALQVAFRSKETFTPYYHSLWKPGVASDLSNFLILSPIWGRASTSPDLFHSFPYLKGQVWPKTSTQLDPSFTKWYAS